MDLELKNINVMVKDRHIIKDVSLYLKQSERIAIIGPSGSGKTTLVKTIVGFTKGFNISGTILLDNKIMQNNHKSCLPIEQRCFGYIPQDLALWPHLSVQQTIRLAIKFAKKIQLSVPAEWWENQLVELCGLSSLVKKYPNSLSGGEKQRLSLARALASQPQWLILDEPFSALDNVAKVEMIKLIKQFHEAFAFGLIFISHNLPEALAIGEQVLVLKQGKKNWLGNKSQVEQAPFTPDWNPLVAII